MKVRSSIVVKGKLKSNFDIVKIYIEKTDIANSESKVYPEFLNCESLRGHPIELRCTMCCQLRSDSIYQTEFNLKLTIVEVCLLLIPVLVNTLYYLARRQFSRLQEKDQYTICPISYKPFDPNIRQHGDPIVILSLHISSTMYTFPSYSKLQSF